MEAVGRCWNMVGAVGRCWNMVGTVGRWRRELEDGGKKLEDGEKSWK